MSAPPSWPTTIPSPAQRRECESVEEAGVDVAREVGAGRHRREERALDERERQEEREERVRRKAGEAASQPSGRWSSPRAGSAGRSAARSPPPAGASCDATSATRSARRRAARRSLALVPRRPRACDPSWRGTRRRATARAAAGRRRGCPRRRARGARPRGRPCRSASRRSRRARRASARRSARGSPWRRSSCATSFGVATTVGRPIVAFSSSGVPSATILPWSMIPTRSARTSASSRYCVVRKTVTPSSFASRPTSAQSALRLCGSSPVVGSSRKRIRGRWTSASARSRRRFIPPE